MDSIQLTATGSTDYELLDSGEEEKLERFGAYILRRPDPQALWNKKLPASDWKKADAWFEREGKQGKWHMKKDMEEEWQITYGGLQFLIRPTSFKHTGLFPEQAPNWDWSHSIILENYRMNPERSVKVLNLFAYTGGATLAAAQAGAEVVHLDASKVAVTWGKQNAEASGLQNAPVRWIVDDAMQFVNRELKRGNMYDAIIMDPPAFGHGPKDELWKIEENFLTFVSSCKKLLSDTPLFFLINGYAAGYSHHAFRYNLESLVSEYGGNVESGELTIEESKAGSPAEALAKEARVLPAGIYARWSN
ncbi:class I SAM-dependent methyltransferase [Patescibacteria group bacterium]|nr:class I SAM-dependent methyltransferase [Patescibacteria group bacterium]